MKEIKDGGPAFGQVVALRCVRVEMNGDTEWEPEAMLGGGLSVRDYFAAKAMQAIYMRLGGSPADDDRESMLHTARYAYAQADAMLIAREN